MHDVYMKIAKDFVTEHFNLSFSIPIVRNNRLHTSLGRFVYSRKNEAIRIELAGFLLDCATEEIIVDVLKHECIHYALFEKGLPHRDGDTYFEGQLIKLGVSRTNRLKVGPYMQYVCEQCNRHAETKNRRLYKRPQMYRTTCCHARLIITGTTVYDGTTIKEEADKGE